MDELANVSRGVKVRVLFDAYYDCDKMYYALYRYGFLWHTTLAANRNVFIDGKKRKVGNYARWAVAHEGWPEKLGRYHASSHRRFRAVSFDATLKGHRLVCFAFYRRKEDRKVFALAYAILTHSRLTATGEKGKSQIKRLVSRDTTRIREVELRNLVPEDSFAFCSASRCIINRFKSGFLAQSSMDPLSLSNK